MLDSIFPPTSGSQRRQSAHLRTSLGNQRDSAAIARLHFDVKQLVWQQGVLAQSVISYSLSIV